jgi:HSP20 family protein
MTNETCMQKREGTQQVTRTNGDDSRCGCQYQPAVDIIEQPGEFVLQADLPGVRPEDTDISFENGMLTIRGTVHPRRPENVQMRRREYGVGDFERSFRIGEGIDTENIAAESKDGVLTVHLPKAAAMQPRKIQVSGS